MRRTLATVLISVLATGCAIPRMFTRFGSRNMRAMTSPAAPPPVHVGQPYRRDAHLALLWIGHATTLIQIDDKVILTDPVFTERVGGLSPRLVEPGLGVHELPPIDVVLLSHMHFDHFSYDSIRMIASRTRALVLPRPGLNYVHPYSFEEVELGRWERWEQDGLEITAVPVQHVGWRWGFDALLRPESFTGYVVEYHGVTVYFGGDTALAPELFRATRERFPNIDLAILPIAPIDPREFMRRTHVDPGEALTAFELLGAKTMVPIHYDTFINSNDQPGDALRALHAALEKRPELKPKIDVLKIGEQRVLIAK